MKLRKLIEAVCGECETAGFKDTAAAETRYEISVAIIGDREFQKINQKFLRRKTISDCLSFDLSDRGKPDSPKIFELVINGQMALRQSKLRGHTTEAELALYITHGLLHQFGYDDIKSAKARTMHKKEDEILNKLGFGTVYNKHTQPRKNKHLQS